MYRNGKWGNELTLTFDKTNTTPARNADCSIVFRKVNNKVCHVVLNCEKTSNLKLCFISSLHIAPRRLLEFIPGIHLINIDYIFQALISKYIHSKLWDEIIYPFPIFNGCNRWSLGMDEQFHPTINLACDYLSILGLLSNHVSKRGHRTANLYPLHAVHFMTTDDLVKHKSRWHDVELVIPEYSGLSTTRFNP